MVAKQVSYTVDVNGAPASSAVLNAIRRIEVEDQIGRAHV